MQASVCVFVCKPRAVPSALRLYRPAAENRPVLSHVGQEVDRDIRMRAAVQNSITMCPEAAHSHKHALYIYKGLAIFQIALDLWFINPPDGDSCVICL